ncbi:MAG: DUF2808 domain-containing protein [Synechococcus sp.]
MTRSLFRLTPRRAGVAAALVAGSIGTASLLLPAAPPAARAQNTPSLLEFRWDGSKDYKKLYFVQSSTQQLERAEYFFMLRPKDRKTAILKLSITVPSYFNARIQPKNLSLCKMKLGGVLSRSRCKEVLPAVFEVNEKQTAIDVFPDSPIPTGGTYAVVMNIFNPNSQGMYQFNALAQAPGDVPVAGYLGSWLIDID